MTFPALSVGLAIFLVICYGAAGTSGCHGPAGRRASPLGDLTTAQDRTAIAFLAFEARAGENADDAGARPSDVQRAAPRRSSPGVYGWVARGVVAAGRDLDEQDGRPLAAVGSRDRSGQNALLGADDLTGAGRHPRAARKQHPNMECLRS